MENFEFSCPGKIICGKDALEKTPDELASLGVTHPLLATDAGLMRLGVPKKLTDVLDRAGITYTIYEDIPADSSLDVVENVAETYRDLGCDGFLALGGGSVIDTCKGAAASIAYAGADLASLQGSEILTNNLPPLIALPTTAGTGSEVTLVAVVKDTAHSMKLSFTSYKLVPHVAILDPKLTASLPPKLTATTGMDALTHAIEAYTSIQKNPVSDAFAVKAIELIAANIKQACAHGEDADARCALALGSLLAGAAFSNAMVGVVHAIGHSLGGLHRIPHGQAMMLLLPHCIEFNIQRENHKGLYGELLPALAPELAVSLGAFATKETRDRLFLEEIQKLNAFFHEAYGVPITLSSFGLTENDLPDVAKQARYDGAALYNSANISLEDAQTILEAAL